MINHWIIYIIMGGIIGSLGSALFYFIRHKNQQDEKRITRALTLRIGLSFVLFLSLFVFYYLDWLHPHGL